MLLCVSLQDLCQLVNADAPYWLVGMTEMTRTFGLELLESVLNDFPGVFLQVHATLLLLMLNREFTDWLTCFLFCRIFFIFPSCFSYYNNVRHFAAQRSKMNALWQHACLSAQHQEFSFLLKERVCPLVIKLFSPNIKFRQGSSSATSPAPVEKPYFPICMRLLRVVSVLIKHFYSLLVRYWFAVIIDWPELAPDRRSQWRSPAHSWYT